MPVGKTEDVTNKYMGSNHCKQEKSVIFYQQLCTTVQWLNSSVSYIR